MNKSLTQSPALSSPKTWYAAYNDAQACRRLVYTLRPIIEQVRSYNKKIIILCIGTDRSTGDALGPLIGSAMLQKKFSPDIKIYGSLDHPVHAVNLPQVKQSIKNKFPNAFVFAIDASLGNADRIGIITAGYGAITPGSGVNKKLPPVGDFHITATVNIGGFMEYTILQNTRLSLVIKIADSIAGILESALS